MEGEIKRRIRRIESKDRERERESFKDKISCFFVSREILEWCANGNETH